MQVTINGERRQVPKDMTIEALLIQLELHADRVAVERNLEVVSRSQWPIVNLQENDRIEIIHFVGGG